MHCEHTKTSKLSTPVSLFEGLLLWLVTVDCTMHDCIILVTCLAFPTIQRTTVDLLSSFLGSMSEISPWYASDASLIGKLVFPCSEATDIFIVFCYFFLHLGYLFKSIWFDILGLNKNVIFLSFFSLVYFYTIYIDEKYYFSSFLMCLWQRKSLFIWKIFFFFWESNL